MKLILGLSPSLYEIVSQSDKLTYAWGLIPESYAKNIKMCWSCKHQDDTNCERDKNLNIPSIMASKSCLDERENELHCGFSARWFESK